MLTIFVNVVLPIFIVAGLGFLVERTMRPGVATLNVVTLYVLMPALVFTSLLQVDFRSELPLKVTLFAFLLAVVMVVVGVIVARLARLDRVTTSALLLTAALPNLGNYGLSVVLLAYGQEGLALATILLAVQSLYGLALATFIASSGHTSVTTALAQVLRQPVIYAVLVALLLNLTGTVLPGFLSAAIALPSQASIPVMLMVLGMTFAGTAGIERPPLVAIAVVTRLFIGTLVGYALTLLLGVEGVARDVMIVGAAMPAAVFTILTATQYNARPRLVTDVVVVSTILSIITVTAVLAILSGRVGLL